MFEECIYALDAAGVQIQRRDMSVILRTHQLFSEHGTLVSLEARDQVSKFVDLNDPKVDPQIRKRLERILPATSKQISYLRRERAVLQSEVEGQLNGDLLLMPTVPDRPPLVSELEKKYRGISGGQCASLAVDDDYCIFEYAFTRPAG